MTRIGFLLLALAVFCHNTQGQVLNKKQHFTYDDTLRGSITDYRKGWDVLRYDLEVQPDIATKSITGQNTITMAVSQPLSVIQIDLQQPLVADSIIGPQGQHYPFTRQNNVCLVNVQFTPATARQQLRLTVYYHGQPKQAKKAPWDGGLVWGKDDAGTPWIATACQGLGASVWWPCKDHQGDEPDNGMSIRINAPAYLAAVSNGRLHNTSNLPKGLKQWHWEVKNPINNYAVTMNIGNYANWTDTLLGEKGTLNLEFWALQQDLDKAKAQFTQAKPMLRAFEHWFGPYPFYEDGYKLVHTPFLGMEHQSAVAYGNQFKNGYLGSDLSATGWGLEWDFIIIHESGHEWFGNNITSTDVADMWVHEGFTNYSETLYTEWLFGQKAGNEYNHGTRRRIANDIPIIGIYGINKEGSGDMYYKGGNLLHLIRHSLDNDALFRSILRGLNQTFYHQTVTTQQVETYISQQSQRNFAPVFDQYLRTTQIPALEYYLHKKDVYYRWSNCNPDFNLQLVLNNNGQKVQLCPTTSWQKKRLQGALKDAWQANAIEQQYYIHVQAVNSKPKL